MSNFMIRKSVIIFSIVLGACQYEPVIQELSPVNSTSDFGEAVYISSNWNSDIYKDYFYFNDYENNKIIVLDSLLQKSLVFGREGKGPGEFSGTGSLTVYEDKIYVVDVGGMRLNVFNLDGGFEKTINLPATNLSWSSFAILNQKLYLPASVRSEFDFLITDLDGTILREIESTGRSVPLNKKSIYAFTNRIAVINQVEPFLILYTDMGELINTFDLREIEELSELWDHYKNSLAESQDGRHSTQLFIDAFVDGSSMYILCAGWPGRDNFGRVLKLEIEQDEIQSVNVFKIEASEGELSLFVSISIKENTLYALESMTGNISEFDLSKSF
jgi:hypothetical protein